METSSITEKRFLYTLLIIVLFITSIIFYPFLTVFILAGSFAIVLKPVYSWIKNHITKNKTGIASFITIILFLILLYVPLFFTGTVIFDQTQNAYSSLATNNNTGAFIQTIDNSINGFLPDGFTFNTYEKITQLFSLFSNNIALFFTSTFNTVLIFMLTVFTIFYLLKDGEKWKDDLIKLTPLSEKHAREIFSSLKTSINHIIKGTFFISIIQGVLAWFGLVIIGFPNPALWGLLSAFASLIPAVGTSVIFIPAVLYLYFTGLHLQALILIIWSIFVVIIVNNILTPYFISKDSNISPIFILFGILGGISIMGPIGIIIGPLILSLLYSLVSIYKKEI
jgi:predicted PurR-regulated permease PerM